MDYIGETSLSRVFIRRYALAHPKEKRIVVVESLLCPTVVRDTLASVFFDHFEVLSCLHILPSANFKHAIP